MRLTDTRWIKAGRSAWDRWWAGDYLPDARFKLGVNTDTVKAYTQFAADMGWEYAIIDWQWYGEPARARTSPVQSPRSIPALVASHASGRSRS